MSESSWTTVHTADIRQGDYLLNCYVPMFGPDFGSEKSRVPVATANLIVITQSCDLEAAKVRMVALCPAHSLAIFEEANPEYRKKALWEQVRKGSINAMERFFGKTHAEAEKAVDNTMTTLPRWQKLLITSEKK